MNKMMKGSVAGAAGVALLMGGFGTYALWSDSEDLKAGTVQSGELDIATTAGVWDDLSTSAKNDWSASELMVPGDKVTYTQTFTVKATGKNMKGKITYNKPSLTGDAWNSLDHSVAVTSDNSDVTAGSGNSFSFSSGFGTATLTAVVTYEMPKSTTGDQDKGVTLPAAAFLIEQS